MKKLLLAFLLIATVAKAQIITFPDPAFKAALLSASPDNNIAWNGTENIKIDANDDGEIDMDEAAEVVTIQFQSGGIVDFTGITNFVNVTYFGSYNNNAHTFPLNGMPNLTTINISGNSSSGNIAFDFNDLPALVNFTFIYANATDISIANAPLLKNVNLWDNDLTALQLESCPALETLTANGNAISELVITNSPVLKEINLNSNQLESIQITDYPLLKKLYLSGNQITDISGFTNLANLEELNISGNQISGFLLTMPALKMLMCGSNNISSLDVSGYPNLRVLTIGDNNIPTIDLSNNVMIQQLSVGGNPMTAIDVSMLDQMITFEGSSLLVSEFDFSGNTALTHFSYANNPNLTFINLKNGVLNWPANQNPYNYNSSPYYGLDNLEYICVDEGDVLLYGLLETPPAIPTGSYCSFTPGGDYNTITGKVYFDSANDGCAASDAQSLIKVNINDGNSTGSSFTDSNGNYVFYTEGGTFDLSPALENPSIFTVSPITAQVVFLDVLNTVTTQDFCITANGVYNDVEVSIIPVVPARPGFDAVYKIIYKNKGNQINNGTITFTYMDDVMDLLSATPAQDGQAAGMLTFNYSNLLPFENRSIEVVVNVNAPTETPAVNIDDVLDFTAIATLNGTDEMPADNAAELNQVVVGSYDPNDKKCIEGNIVSTFMIGEYLHYVINFENTGTDVAQNIIIRDDIDVTKFDMSSIQLMHSSHDSDIRLQGTRIECFFKNIYLPIGGHGNILLKIKTLGTLIAGDIVTNRASIFFDYNFPVITNFAETTFSTLGVGENDVNHASVYPNPTDGLLTIQSAQQIDSVEMYDIQGRILQRSAVGASEYFIDLSERQSGVYFVKIISAGKQSVYKVIKN